MHPQSNTWCSTDFAAEVAKLRKDLQVSQVVHSIGIPITFIQVVSSKVDALKKHCIESDRSEVRCSAYARNLSYGVYQQVEEDVEFLHLCKPRLAALIEAGVAGMDGCTPTAPCHDNFNHQENSTKTHSVFACK